MDWPSASSNTMDLSTDTFLLRVVRDNNDLWIVSEDETAAYGCGRTLLEAMADFWHALQALTSALEGRPCTPYLQGQVDRARWMLEVHRG